MENHFDLKRRIGDLSDEEIRTAYTKAWEQIQSLKAMVDKLSSTTSEEKELIIRLQGKILEVESFL